MHNDRPQFRRSVPPHRQGTPAQGAASKGDRGGPAMRMTWVLMLLAVGAGRLAAAEAEPAEWWSVEKRVVEELLQRDAGQWAHELHGQRMPTAAGELMLRFSVFNRAGHLRQARAAIDAMSEGGVPKHQLPAMADFLIGRKDFAIARYFLERLPQA